LEIVMLAHDLLVWTQALLLTGDFANAEPPSLSTSDETLTIEESMNLEGENGERRNVGDEHEWSWSCG